MRTSIIIAKNTFKETIRDRILYTILGFAFLFLLFTVFLGSISLGEDLIIIRNIGLAGIYLFGLIITIFLGTSMLYKEVEKKTIYFMLSRPVTPAEIIVGKTLGLMASVSLTVLFMALIYALVVFSKGGGFDFSGMLSIFLELWELLLFISLAIFFSTFAILTPLTSITLTVVVLYIGHSLDLLLKAAKKLGGVAYILSLGLYYIFPNLEKFNMRSLAAHNILPKPEELMFTILYALIYASALLILAQISFKRREF
jgi:ABC-type transport system involved in multi-copper enzyme maturation permease subunit